MTNILEKRMLLEGRFIGDFAVIFPPVDTKDFGFKALKKAYEYIQRNYDFPMDRLDREVYAILGTVGKNKYIEITWEETSDMRLAQAKGTVYTLSLTGPDRREHQINTYKDLDNAFKKYGVPKL